jgi:hypothetical protein
MTSNSVVACDKQGKRLRKVPVASTTVTPRKDALPSVTSWTKSESDGIHNSYDRKILLRPANQGIRNGLNMWLA